MNVFDVVGLSFAHPGSGPALQDVSFKVESGERIVLLGANGSGKSTLLHLLNGLYFASEGHVTALGTVLTEKQLDRTTFNDGFRRQVGFLFQDSDSQLFCPSVRDELAYGPLQLGLTGTEIENRVSDVLTLLEIEPFGDRSPQALSAGQKRLVALGSLLTLAPSVLLLDEPTAGLDAKSQCRLLDLLDGLSDAGATLVTATHDLWLASEVADRALVLDDDHRIAFNGPLDAVLKDADLLSKVNLLCPRMMAAQRRIEPA